MVDSSYSEWILSELSMHRLTPVGQWVLPILYIAGLVIAPKEKLLRLSGKMMNDDVAMESRPLQAEQEEDDMDIPTLETPQKPR